VAAPDLELRVCGGGGGGVLALQASSFCNFFLSENKVGEAADPSPRSATDLI